MLKCEHCGYIFEDPVTRYEVHNDYYKEPYGACPRCEFPDYYIVKKCSECGEYEDIEDMQCGMCKSCFDDVVLGNRKILTEYISSLSIDTLQSIAEEDMNEFEEWFEREYVLNE